MTQAKTKDTRESLGYTREKWPEPRTIFNDRGHPVCGATTMLGLTCFSAHLEADGRCNKHSIYRYKKSPLSSTNPVDRSASIIQALPLHLQEAFQRSLDDPAQLSVKIEIGLLDTDLARHLETLENVPTTEDWGDISEVLQELQLSIQASNSEATRRCSLRLEHIVATGSRTNAAWDKIKETLFQRAKLAEIETKRLVSSRVVMSTAEAELMVINLFRVLARNITDPNLLRTIKDQFVDSMKIPDNMIESSDDDLSEE